MKCIGIDKRDPSYRHFYFDDSKILTSNPPKYSVKYVDDENDIDYIECSKVMVIKRIEEPVLDNNQAKNVDVYVGDNNQAKPKTEVKLVDTNSDDFKLETVEMSYEEPKVVKVDEPKKRGRKKKETKTEDVVDETIIVDKDRPENTNAVIGNLLQNIKYEYEYKVIDIEFSSAVELETLLNGYGKEMWELCSYSLYNEGLIFEKKKVMCIMKRYRDDITTI